MDNKTIDMSINKGKVEDNRTDKKTLNESQVLSNFDDISLCDNSSTNDDSINGIPINVTNHCDHRLDDNILIDDVMSCDKSEDKQSMDSTPIETPICGSNVDEEEVISDESNDSDFIEELKKRNGVLFDLKLIEEKYENKIISLQTERNELQNEIEETKRKLNEQELSFNELKTRLTTNLEKVSKQNESKRKELESMVIKYATSEREVIHLKKIREENEKKMKDMIKDKESLMVRIKGLSNEKTQLMSSLDRKVVEISSLQRDYDKLNNELKDRDSKWKQTQTKLKEEINAHNETKTKLDSVNQKTVELKEEAEGLRKELHDLLHSNEDSDKDIAANSDNALTKIEHLTNEIENYKKKMTVYIEENHSLTTKIQTLERERLDHEQSVSKLKETVNELQIEISDYMLKLRDMEQLKIQLDRQKELVSDFQKESERLKSSNNELRAEMESCRHKEGELLEFTERLTAKTVHLQSEHNILEQKSVMLKEDVERLQKQCEELSKDNSNLNQTLDQLKESHQKEVGLLARKLAEKTKLSDELKVKVDELENETRVNKRRHVTSIKELNKELSAMKKRLEHFEGQSISTQSDCVSIGSRTSSSNSLTDALSGNNHTNSSSNNSHLSQPKSSVSIPQTSSTDSTNSSTPTISILPEVDKQVLIDRILRLQKSLAKRNEKIDFFEEHNQQLIEEMKKKSKLVQYYIMREETGALSTSSMDDHKVSQRFIFIDL